MRTYFPAARRIAHYNRRMAVTRELPCTLIPIIQSPDEITLRSQDVVHVEENALRNCDAEFSNAEESAIVKPEGSAWIDSETLDEMPFRWQDLGKRRTGPE